MRGGGNQSCRETGVYVPGILFQDDLAACSITAAPRSPPKKKGLFPDRLRGCIQRGALWGIPRVDLRKEMGGGDGAWGWGRSSFAGCSALLQASRRPWLSLHPAPGVCPAGRWQATGSRARPGRVLAPRGRRRRLQPPLGRLDGAHPGALPGPSALALSGQSLVQLRGSLGRGAAEKADGANCTALVDGEGGDWGASQVASTQPGKSRVSPSG